MNKPQKTEKIFCPTCGYQINDPRNMRCPRCLTPVYSIRSCNGNCGKCRAEKSC